MMTSAFQYINNIDPLYPKPGQDNNSQGFRNNFSNTKTALENLDTYMSSLAATTLNVNAPYVTATQHLTALRTLNIGTDTSLSIAFQNNNLVVMGKNPGTNGGPAAGALAFFPYVLPIGVIGYGSDAVGDYFVASNPTTDILDGATFHTIAFNPTTLYTVTGVDGQHVYFLPYNTNLDPVVNINNPTFGNYTVINASTVTNLISEALSGIVVLNNGTQSLTKTNGTLVVTGNGGVGIGGNLNVGGDVSFGGDLTIGGSFISTSTANSFNGLDINGDLVLHNAKGDFIPSLTLNTSSFINSFNPIFGGTPQSGEGTGHWQKLPGGMIIQWGQVPGGLGSSQYIYSFPIPFPTAAFVIFSEVASALNIQTDNYTQGTRIISNTQFEISQDYGASQYWFAIGC
jgi:hypothetical protein